MYTQFFGLKQEPFSIAPDPRYLYMSERHREALAHLLYGVGSGGGFVLLSGEIGAGKTTVCRCFLEQIPRRTNVAYIFNPKLTVTELLKSVCDEFGVPYEHEGGGTPTVKDYIDPLNEFLLKTHGVGQNNVLIIDEAQNLSADVLEQLRLLTNLETNERKLLQIILIGQPELRTLLARPELEQLAQRVIARFHLEALSETETAQYIRHRLGVAGMGRAIPFSRSTMRRIHRLARGVPRRINLLCDRALLGAYSSGQPSVDLAIVDKAAREVFGTEAGVSPSRVRRRHLAVAGLGLTAAASLFAAVAYTMGAASRDAPAASAKAASSAALASGPASAAKVVLNAVVSPRSAASAAVVGTSTASAPLSLAPADFAARFDNALHSESDAWRELAAAWKIEPGDGDPCVAAQRQQVQCFKSASTTLAMIRQLGRPGIVTLRDGDDKPMFALLTGLTQQGATLRMGDRSATLSFASLASMWRGDFATYWRTPPGYANKVIDDSPGPMAEWLSAKLATLQPSDAAFARYTTLRSRIAAFQLAQGLKVDGLAGPTTLMQLNRAIGIDEPRLQTQAGL